MLFNPQSCRVGGYASPPQRVRCTRLPLPAATSNRAKHFAAVCLRLGRFIFYWSVRLVKTAPGPSPDGAKAGMFALFAMFAPFRICGYSVYIHPT